MSCTQNLSLRQNYFPKTVLTRTYRIPWLFWSLFLRKARSQQQHRFTTKREVMSPCKQPSSRNVRATGVLPQLVGRCPARLLLVTSTLLLLLRVYVWTRSLWTGIFFWECLTPKSVLFFTKETTEEGAQGPESKEDNEELNKKQEGPEMVVDPAESRSSKSRYLCVALTITQPFLAFTCYWQLYFFFNSPSKLILKCCLKLVWKFNFIYLEC